MKFDILDRHSWEETNEALQQALPRNLCPATAAVRVYGGLAPAVFELAFGIAILYSHRKSAAVIPGRTWAFESLLPHLYKEGFSVRELMADQDSSALVKAVDELKKDTLFCLWSEDHPVLGTYWSGDELDAKLNDRKIFSIRVSHAAFHYRPQPIRPYSVRICSLAPRLTVAVLGEKVNPPPLAVHRLPWDLNKIVDNVLQALKVEAENQEAVSDFESRIEKLTGFRRFIDGDHTNMNGDHRIFDRAVIYHPEVNADAVLRTMAPTLGFAVGPAGSMPPAEILNLCRWAPNPPLAQWWKPEPKPEVLRGFLCLSLSLIAKTNVDAALVAGEREAKSLSG
ncbi:MAG: hypothetical protein C5B49_05650 [Bdellovibrio sp.]|nr:MAG: hypothetical protein C5B49_05650 [Bdellovibrio sp.]